MHENTKAQIAKELALKALEPESLGGALRVAESFDEAGKMIADLFNAILKNIPG